MTKLHKITGVEYVIIYTHPPQPPRVPLTLDPQTPRPPSDKRIEGGDGEEFSLITELPTSYRLGTRFQGEIVSCTFGEGSFATPGVRVMAGGRYITRCQPLKPLTFGG